MSDRPQFDSYDGFWLFYLREHSSSANRWLHFVGTSLAFVLLIVAVALQLWYLLFAVPVAGYTLAWIGHFFVERNQPASFKYPGWSFISDLRMWALTLSGCLGRELERAAAEDPPAGTSSGAE